jgi:hypothetical protein
MSAPTRHARLVVACLAACLLSAGRAQIDGRQTSAATGGAAMLAGAVVERTSQVDVAPLAGAAVRVTRDDGSSRSTTSDAAGRFQFDALPPGRYVLTAEKPAYIRMAYGATRFAQPGTPIVLGRDDHAGGYRIVTFKGGVLAGAITNASGTPVSGATVAALRRVVADDGTIAASPLAPVSAGDGATLTARTNGRGEFRLFGLPPGRYVLQAALPAILTPPHAIARGFYPSAVVAQDAQVLVVDERTELSGLIFAPPVVRVVAVAGRVSAPSGTLASARVVLQPDFPGRSETAARPTGEFTFDGVPEGAYTVDARALVASDSQAAQSRRRLWGRAETFVTTTGENRVDVALRAALDLPVDIVLRGTARAPEPSKIEVALESLRPWQQEPAIVGTTTARRLTLRDVAPGRYALLARALDAAGSDLGWRVMQILADGRDVTDADLAIPDIGATLVVTMTDQVQIIDGRLIVPAGAPAVSTTVVVFPADHRLWLPRSRRLAIARPGTDGRFSFTGLPAGDYRMIALLDPDMERIADPSFLETLMPASFAVSLAPGEHKTLDLRTAN